MRCVRPGDGTIYQLGFAIRALDGNCARPVTPPSAGRLVAIPEVGGLHHRYDRIAA